ncbi:MAG: sugar ABC transporter substrate-binding protein [Bacteroidetes bacterium]|nr:MAG: sugar ABC transporter substrate-binding protein [Bacteroidota bacterium]
MSRISYFLSIATLSLLVACQSSPKENSADASGSKALRIAIIPKGSTHMHWRSVHAGANKAASELGVEVLWQSSQKEDDRQQQIQLVQNAISQQVDAILLAPLDDQALVAPVKTAVNRGIPVLIFDSNLKSDVYSSYIATDNYMGGKLCGKRLAEVMGEKGKVLVLRYEEGSASTAEREKGFLDAIKEYPGMEIISENQYAGATLEKALKASQNLLNRFPETEGIFCPDESSTHGMLRALQIAGKAGKVHFVGFDSSEPLLEAVRKGELDGVAVQAAFKMGYLGLKTAVAVLRKESYERTVDTGVTMVTRENVDSPDLKEVLYPDLATWLKE